MQNRQAALLAIVGGISIFAIKLGAYFLSNSVALLSDALESIVNIAASGLMLFAVHISERPADADHPYGHRKVEEISSMLEGLFILTAAVLIVYAAAGRLFDAPELVELNVAIAISIVATALNGGLSWFLGQTAKTSGSAALEGDSKHLLSDVISSVGIWIGLFIAQLTGWQALDAILAFIVAALITNMGGSLVFRSAQHLMDQACREEETRIRNVFLQHKAHFIDFHDMKTRRNGNQIYSELHLSVDSALTVKDAHALTDHLEGDVRQEVPNATLTIHIEPHER